MWEKLIPKVKLRLNMYNSCLIQLLFTKKNNFFTKFSSNIELSIKGRNYITHRWDTKTTLSSWNTVHVHAVHFTLCSESICKIIHMEVKHRYRVTDTILYKMCITFHHWLWNTIFKGYSRVNTKGNYWLSQLFDK